MIEVVYDRGVFLPRYGLWLDPQYPRDFAFVSHAHSDHTERHRHTLCTPATARLMETRMGGDLGHLEVLNFHETRTFNDFAVTLLPAGHVLGSAQLYLEAREGSLLYTGDFKRRKGLSSESVMATGAETLIMETTYGLPRYQFPPAETTIAAVVKFCIEAMEEEETPILLGYALGKAQEILAVLRDAGLDLVLHPGIAKIARVYEEFGVVFPPYTVLGEKAHGVLICPPSFNGSKAMRQIKHRRVAVLTGWALDGSAKHRMGVDEAFPLSDHADYNDLLKHVEEVQPKRVLTLHGFAQEFARDLRARGLEAWALTGVNQLEFSMALPESSQPTAVTAELINAGFNAFCLVAEAIRGTTGKLEKVRILGDYLRGLNDEELQLAAVWLGGRAFPQSDDNPINVGGAVIRKALSGASGRPEAELKSISRRHNDAGLTTTEAMSQRAGNEVMPLAEVTGILASLRSARGPHLKAEILTKTLCRMPAMAAGYFVRIITGDLRIGLKEGLVEEAIAKAFEVEAGAFREASMLLGDTGRAALLARTHSLEEAGLVFFQPVKCMLASPEPDAAAIWERLGGGGSVWMEDKLDGIRAQVHCTPERVEIYSRDLKRITASFPEIAAAFCKMKRKAVFDGEILAWEGERALSFFELQKRLGRRDADLFLGEQIPVGYVAFDLLALDEKSLLRSSLRERRALLERLILPSPLRIAPVASAAGPESIETAFGVARQRGNEGLMAKDPTSLYLPGRRGLAWIKYKKEFATLDVVVVAVEYGHGRRSKVLSDYTFAVRDEISGELKTIGKAYSGLTDVEIAELTEEFLRVERGRKGNRLEVEPIVVLEIAFDSIQPSQRHNSGLALRFPRIKAIRRDKTPAEIDTVASARRLAGL